MTSRLDAAIGIGVGVWLAAISAMSAPPENLAPSGTARASSEGYGSVAADAIDGNRDGHFYNAGSVWHTVLPDAFPSFFEVDLGGTYFLDRVMIWPRTDAPDQATVENFALQVMDEAGQVVWTADYWPSTAVNWAWGTTALRGVAGRTVRFERRDGTPNFLTFAEIEVHGGLVEPTPNFARAAGAVVTASSAAAGMPASAAVDGDLNANQVRAAVSKPVYQSAAAGAGQYWQVDLGVARPVDYVILYARQDAAPTGEVAVSLRDDAGAEVYSARVSLRRTALVQGGSRFDVPHDIPDAVVARFMRIETVAAEPLALAEVEVFGIPTDLSAPTLVRTTPASGELLAELSLIEVDFNEPVAGVTADDLRVAGAPAATVTPVSPKRYAFAFAQPPSGRVDVSFAPGHGITDLAGNGFVGAAWSVTLDTSLPAPRPIITEIMADNRGGLRDEEGESPDWIEIYNPGPTTVDLGGWHLSDTPATPGLWKFPAPTTLAPGAWLVVFASGKDRAVAGAPLHTNFKLDPDGESVLLVKPDAVTVASQILQFPPQRENVSFGLGRTFTQSPLLAAGSVARVLVPAAAIDNWTGRDFDDSAWPAGPLAFGFDVGGGTSGDGLLGWWNFDDSSDATVAADVTGQGRDGVIARATYSSNGQGRTGAAGDRALVFSGTGVVSFPDAADGAFDAIAARDAFTLSLWAYGASTMPVDNYVFYGSSGTNGSGTRVLDAHLPWSDSVIYFDTAGCCDPGETRISFSEPDTTKWRGQWNHYVFVKNGDTKQVWQNGQLRHQATNMADQPPLRSLFLGAINSNGTTGYRGRLDDFALWEGALDGAQIAALAGGTPPPDVRSLAPAIGTDLAAVMHGKGATAYVRAAFDVPDVAGIDLLTLRIRYDDGFVAYLNGIEVARRNAPAVLAFDSAAAGARPGGDALVPEEIDISRFATLLVAGTNRLAIHGLNQSAEDGEFLIHPELLAGRSQPDRYFTDPTPGRPNGDGATAFVADVKFSPQRGHYDSPVTVTLSCATPGATIVFTTDGSEPGATHGTAGPSPVSVEITTTTTLRATAIQGTLAPTNIDTHTYLYVDHVAAQTRPAGAPASWPGGFSGDYLMDPRVPGPSPAPGFTLKDSLLAVPSLSLVTDPAGLWGTTTGIYANPSGRGRDWERFTSFEWIDPADAGEAHAGVGLRIHGNISRNKDFTPKHSFHLRFRGDYGDPKLKASLFPGSPVDEFDELVLRAGSTDTWPCTEWGVVGLGLNGQQYQRWNRDWASYIRDQWVRDAHLAMGQNDFRGRFCHLYLNGCYWGLYNMTEAPSASHMAAHLGGRETEWDTVADFNELREGSRSAWDDLLQLANGGQLGTDAGLRRVQGLDPDGARNPALPRLLDVDNLIDYMILHIAIGADDWPDHNWWGARPSRAEDPDGYRFFAWDQEISNENVLYGRSSWGPIYAEANADGTPTRVYSRLRASPEFRQRFADRIHRHLFNGGALTEESNVARWQQRVDEIDKAVIAESARWGDAQPNHTRPGQPYTRDNGWLPHLAWMAVNYWPKHHATALARYRAANLYPAVAAPRLSPHGGPIAAAATTATLTDPNAAGGTLHFTTNGDDPRLWGGGVAPAAQSSLIETTIPLPGPVTIKARVRQGTTWSALTEATFTREADRDNDGIDDAWELANGLSPDDAGDAASDSDGDGASAREEYFAGTDPRSAASSMRLALEASHSQPGEVTLRFHLPPGRTYVVEYSDSLNAPNAWATLATFGPEAAGLTIERTESIPTARRFFRLRAAVTP